MTLLTDSASVLKTLQEKGYVVLDDVLGSDVCLLAVRQCESLRLRSAAMGSREDNRIDPSLRGDRIQWTTTEDLATRPQLNSVVQALHALSDGLVELGIDINRRECQVAVYDGNGTRYTRHRDTSSRVPNRRVTSIMYLTKGGDSEGGNLVLYPRVGSEEQGVVIQPKPGRLVVFLSYLEHEVLPTFCTRVAVTLFNSGEKLLTQDSPTIVPETFCSILPEAVQLKLLGLLGCHDPSDSMSQVDKKLDEFRTPFDGETDEIIYVSIVAYRDPECKYTVRDMMEKAASPSRVQIHVLWQANADSDDGVPVFSSEMQRENTQVNVEVWEHTKARGPAYARCFSQSTVAGAKYYLQLDSHMRFVKDWDTVLIRMINLLPSKKALLSTYPPPYELPSHISTDRRPTQMYAKSFDSCGVLRLASRRVDAQQPEGMRSPFVAAGFAFMPVEVLECCMYPDGMEGIFFGEEMVWSLLLWSYGWDVYSPPVPVVFHLWERSNRPTFWEVLPEGAKGQERSQQERKLALKRSILRRLATEREQGAAVETEPDERAITINFGSERSITEWESFAAVNLREGIVIDR